ncbi:glycerate kinase [bacterium c-19]|nr:glycerate kinase [bacterium c-19]
MKVVVACDSFKGCLKSEEVAYHVEQGIHRFDDTIDVISYAIGDGGEGSAEAFAKSCQGIMVKTGATDAYGKKIITEYALIENGQTAVIEVASIIGLSMTPKERRTPFFGSSFGVGTVMLDAVNRGCKKIILALGGSATNDGGMGLLQALGCRFYDNRHKYLSPQAVNLDKIKYIDFNRLNRLDGIEIIAACDVKNHLLGENGATYVFGKQKGFYPNQIKQVDEAMHNYRDQIQRYLDIDINAYEGGGAAGGIGSVVIGILHAKMVSGIQLLFQYCDIEQAIQACDLVITGEGQSDRQTIYGKVPVGVLEIANRYRKPTLCISGALGLGYQELYDLGFIGIFSIADRAMSFQQALDQAGEKMEAAVYTIMKTIVSIQGRL